MERECTEATFLRDVAHHEMQVLQNEGVYRHLRFKAPDTICMQFDLITWPGHLCYTCDMGTYVFSRDVDMFAFFRDSRIRPRGGNSLGINRKYWAEKVLSIDRHGGIKEFSDELFARAVKEYLIQWVREHAHKTTKQDRRSLWKLVVQEVINVGDGEHGGYQKKCAVNEFNCYVNIRVGDFCFRGFWERTLEDYTRHFVWCCYAISWGIAKYDAEVSHERLEGLPIPGEILKSNG